MKLIPLTQGKFTKVDDEDFEDLSKFTWVADNKKCTFYALTTHPVRIYLHRKIMGAKNSKISVDHIDRDGLNNQKSNLRLCNQSENIRNSKLSKNNTTGFKGVMWHKGANKFMAYIRHDYKMYNLGLFKTAKEAAIARNKKSLELHGKFAYVNPV